MKGVELKKVEKKKLKAKERKAEFVGIFKYYKGFEERASLQAVNDERNA